MNAGTITIKCFGTLRTKMASEQKVTISENEPIRDVAERLSIELQPSYLYAVNGRHAEPDTSLHNGDILLIIPPISGG